MNSQPPIKKLGSGRLYLNTNVASAVPPLEPGRSSPAISLSRRSSASSLNAGSPRLAPMDFSGPVSLAPIQAKPTQFISQPRAPPHKLPELSSSVNASSSTLAFPPSHAVHKSVPRARNKAKEALAITTKPRSRANSLTGSEKIVPGSTGIPRSTPNSPRIIPQDTFTASASLLSISGSFSEDSKQTTPSRAKLPDPTSIPPTCPSGARESSHCTSENRKHQTNEALRSFMLASSTPPRNTDDTAITDMGADVVSMDIVLDSHEDTLADVSFSDDAAVFALYDTGVAESTTIIPKEISADGKRQHQARISVDLSPSHLRRGVSEAATNNVLTPQGSGKTCIRTSSFPQPQYSARHNSSSGHLRQSSDNIVENVSSSVEMTQTLDSEGGSGHLRETIPSPASRSAGKTPRSTPAPTTPPTSTVSPAASCAPTSTETSASTSTSISPSKAHTTTASSTTIGSAIATAATGIGTTTARSTTTSPATAVTVTPDAAAGNVSGAAVTTGAANNVRSRHNTDSASSRGDGGGGEGSGGRSGDSRRRGRTSVPTTDAGSITSPPDVSPKISHSSKNSKSHLEIPKGLLFLDRDTQQNRENSRQTSQVRKKLPSPDALTSLDIGLGVGTSRSPSLDPISRKKLSGNYHSNSSFPGKNPSRTSSPAPFTEFQLASPSVPIPTPVSTATTNAENSENDAVSGKNTGIFPTAPPVTSSSAPVPVVDLIHTARHVGDTVHTTVFVDDGMSTGVTGGGISAVGSLPSEGTADTLVSDERLEMNGKNDNSRMDSMAASSPSSITSPLATPSLISGKPAFGNNSQKEENGIFPENPGNTRFLPPEPPGYMLLPPSIPAPVVPVSNSSILGKTEMRNFPKFPKASPEEFADWLMGLSYALLEQTDAKEKEKNTHGGDTQGSVSRSGSHVPLRHASDPNASPGQAGVDNEGSGLGNGGRGIDGSAVDVVMDGGGAKPRNSDARMGIQPCITTAGPIILPTSATQHPPIPSNVTNITPNDHNRAREDESRESRRHSSSQRARVDNEPAVAVLGKLSEAGNVGVNANVDVGVEGHGQGVHVQQTAVISNHSATNNSTTTAHSAASTANLATTAAAVAAVSTISNSAPAASNSAVATATLGTVTASSATTVLTTRVSGAPASTAATIISTNTTDITATPTTATASEITATPTTTAAVGPAVVSAGDPTLAAETAVKTPARSESGKNVNVGEKLRPTPPSRASSSTSTTTSALTSASASVSASASASIAASAFSTPVPLAPSSRSRAPHRSTSSPSHPPAAYTYPLPHKHVALSHSSELGKEKLGKHKIPSRSPILTRGLEYSKKFSHSFDSHRNSPRNDPFSRKSQNSRFFTHTPLNRHMRIKGDSTESLPSTRLICTACEGLVSERPPVKSELASLTTTHAFPSVISPLIHKIAQNYPKSDDQVDDYVKEGDFGRFFHVFCSDLAQEHHTRYCEHGHPEKDEERHANSEDVGGPDAPHRLSSSSALCSSSPPSAALPLHLSSGYPSLPTFLALDSVQALWRRYGITPTGIHVTKPSTNSETILNTGMNNAAHNTTGADTVLASDRDLRADGGSDDGCVPSGIRTTTVGVGAGTACNANSSGGGVYASASVLEMMCLLLLCVAEDQQRTQHNTQDETPQQDSTRQYEVHDEIHSRYVTQQSNKNTPDAYQQDTHRHPRADVETISPLKPRKMPQNGTPYVPEEQQHFNLGNFVGFEDDDEQPEDVHLYSGPTSITAFTSTYASTGTSAHAAPPSCPPLFDRCLTTNLPLPTVAAAADEEADTDTSLHTSMSALFHTSMCPSMHTSLHGSMATSVDTTLPNVGDANAARAGPITHDADASSFIAAVSGPSPSASATHAHSSSAEGGYTGEDNNGGSGVGNIDGVAVSAHMPPAPTASSTSSPFSSQPHSRHPCTSTTSSASTTSPSRWPPLSSSALVTKFASPRVKAALYTVATNTVSTAHQQHMFPSPPKADAPVTTAPKVNALLSSAVKASVGTPITSVSPLAIASQAATTSVAAQYGGAAMLSATNDTPTAVNADADISTTADTGTLATSTMSSTSVFMSMRRPGNPASTLPSRPSTHTSTASSALAAPSPCSSCSSSTSPSLSTATAPSHHTTPSTSTYPALPHTNVPPNSTSAARTIARGTAADTTQSVHDSHTDRRHGTVATATSPVPTATISESPANIGARALLSPDDVVIVPHNPHLPPSPRNISDYYENPEFSSGYMLDVSKNRPYRYNLSDISPVQPRRRPYSQDNQDNGFSDDWELSSEFYTATSTDKPHSDSECLDLSGVLDVIPKNMVNNLAKDADNTQHSQLKSNLHSQMVSPASLSPPRHTYTTTLVYTSACSPSSVSTDVSLTSTRTDIGVSVGTTSSTGIDNGIFDASLHSHTHTEVTDDMDGTIDEAVMMSVQAHGEYGSDAHVSTDYAFSLPSYDGDGDGDGDIDREGEDEYGYGEEDEYEYEYGQGEGQEVMDESASTVKESIYCVELVNADDELNKDDDGDVNDCN